MRRAGQGVRHVMGAVLKAGVDSLAAFCRAGGPGQAAALAFYALLSIIPLFFLVASFYGAVAGDSWAAQVLLRRELADMAPFFDDELFSRVRRLIWAGPALTWQSLAFILWSSWLLVGALRRHLALPWREAPGVEDAPVWRRRLGSLLWGPVAGFLFVGAVTGGLALAHLPRLQPPESLLRQLSPAWGIACLTGLLVAVYALFLPRRRPFRAMLGLSAALAVAAWGVSSLFEDLLAGLPRYHLVYGSLTGAVLFLLWLDYNAMLVLWGGWFLRVWQRDHAVSRPNRRLAVAGWLRRVRLWRRTSSTVKAR